MPKRPKTTQEILRPYELDEVDRKLLSIKINYVGISNSELGQIVGLSRRAVEKRINRAQWQKAFEDYHLPAKTLVEKSAERLTRRYLKLAESPDERVAERVIRAILISIGVLKNKVEHEGKVGVTLEGLVEGSYKDNSQ